MRLWLHKLWHWEYWPVFVLYMPTFFLWLWFAIKFRSHTFYKYANPSIRNGGLYGDSKYDIYKLLPKGLFPKTVLIEINKEYDILQILIENKIDFPLIVKPDMGFRGNGVKKINSICDLMTHKKAAQENFLIQEFIEHPNEIGLFYCRLPNRRNGKITGLTIKKFLIVKGNGIETIEEQLRKNPRFEMQIPKLSDQINLSEILYDGEERCLVPYGNHNRGTEFQDGKNLITEKLEQTFDSILKNIKGFYYGRLDIRYNTFEELEKGVNFSIIELNGVKSEPTHIYDNKKSFWRGQREIFKHQRLLKQIVKTNLHNSSGRNLPL